VVTTGQQLMNMGNDWGQDPRTLGVLAVAAVILMPTAVAALRAATR